MTSVIEAVGYGAMIPAGVSLAVYGICRRCLPAAAAERYAAAAAVGLAFFLGYALLPSWAALLPERHWHWLPYLGAGAMMFGPLALAQGLLPWERAVVHATLALAAAWLIVPAWASLQPPRPVWMALVAAWLWLLIAGLDALPDRLRGRLFLVHLTVAAIVVALLLAAAISLKYGQVALVAAAALTGCCLAAFIWRQPPAARGLIPAYALLVGGAAFVGCIELEPPRPLVLLAPAAPLALWLFAGGPLARLEGRKRAAVQTGAVLVPLAIALVWVLID